MAKELRSATIAVEWFDNRGEIPAVDKQWLQEAIEDLFKAEGPDVSGVSISAKVEVVEGRWDGTRRIA